jgi:hypothetical protein
LHIETKEDSSRETQHDANEELLGYEERGKREKASIETSSSLPFFDAVPLT